MLLYREGRQVESRKQLALSICISPSEEYPILSSGASFIVILNHIHNSVKAQRNFSVADTFHREKWILKLFSTNKLTVFAFLTQDALPGVKYGRVDEG